MRALGSPTSRLLALLELLQERPVVTGRQLAEQLGVERRTVRRYVALLQELGIPVEGQRGVGGGYRLRPGYRLPPLMLSDDEAVVVVLGLLAARRYGMDTENAAVDRALEKIHRILPLGLRRQVEALEQALGFTRATVAGAPVPGDTVLMLADAIRRHRRVRTAYRSFSGADTSRELSPYGLVVHAGRWYLAAHDHGREDTRTFRIDRMSSTTVGRETALAPPDGFDAVAYVSGSLARVPWTWDVEVELDLSLESASARIPPTLAELAEEDGRSCACGWSRSTGRPASWPGSAVPSRSAGRRSFGTASASSQPVSPAPRRSLGCPQRVEGLPDQRGQLRDRRCIVLGEVGAALFVGELEHAVTAVVLSAHRRGEPAPHGRVLGRLLAEPLPRGVCLHLALRQPDHLAGRDLEPVQAEPGWIRAKVAVGLVLGAQAEVLARLRGIAVHPKLECRLLGAGQRASEATGPPQQRVDALSELVLVGLGVDDRRDLGPDLALVHHLRLAELRRYALRPEGRETLIELFDRALVEPQEGACQGGKCHDDRL
jgi:predicted DNA-binding transcriptional regulator YafY